MTIEQIQKDGQTINKQEPFFAKLIEALEKDPETGLQATAANKDKIVNTIGARGRHAGAALLGHMDLTEKEEDKNISLIDEFITRAEAANDKELLIQVVTAYAPQIADLKLRKRVIDAMSMISMLPNEIEMFRSLETRLEALEKAWSDGTSNPLKEVAEIYKYMKNKLLEELEMKYRDPVFANAIREELSNKGKYDSPIPHPTPLKTLVLTTLTKLERGDVATFRFVEGKKELLQVLEEKQKDEKTEKSQQAGAVRDLVEDYSADLGSKEQGMAEATISNLNYRATMINLIGHTAVMKKFLEEAIADIARTQNEEELKGKYLAYTTKYEQMGETLVKYAKEVENQKKVRSNRQKVAMGLIKKFGRSGSVFGRIQNLLTA
jgi:hypothetical protein